MIHRRSAALYARLTARATSLRRRARCAKSSFASSRAHQASSRRLLGKTHHVADGPMHAANASRKLAVLLMDNHWQAALRGDDDQAVAIDMGPGQALQTIALQQQRQ